MKILKKIEVMHHLFGKKDKYLCGECKNFVSNTYHGKTYRKCIVYGQSRAVSTDWSKKYIACGMFNKDHVGKQIVKTGVYRIELPLEGQMQIEVE